MTTTTEWEPQVLGPTWYRGPDGKFVLPERTLGHECLRWCYLNLKNADGTPWQFTKEQARFILWWYALDERGRFVFTDGVLQRVKGWG